MKTQRHLIFTNESIPLEGWIFEMYETMKDTQVTSVDAVIKLEGGSVITTTLELPKKKEVKKWYQFWK